MIQIHPSFIKRFYKAILLTPFLLNSAFASLIIHLDGTKGVIAEDDRVEKWENQVGDFYHAVSDGFRRPAFLHEALPGHGVISLDGTNDFMELIGTEALTNTEVTVFFVGRINATSGGNASFFGSYRSSSDDATGWSLAAINNSGGYRSLVGNGSWKGASDDFSGASSSTFGLVSLRYTSHEDGSSSLEVRNSVSGETIVHSSATDGISYNSKAFMLGVTAKFNSNVDEYFTALDTAEIKVYDESLSDIDFDAQWDSLMTKYSFQALGNLNLASISSSGFSVPTTGDTTLTFSAPLDPDTVDLIKVKASSLDGLPIGSYNYNISGTWSLSVDDTVATFQPNSPYPAGQLIIIDIPRTVLSASGAPYDTNANNIPSFITDNGKNYTVTSQVIDPMAIVYNGSTAHTLPMSIDVPDAATPRPVMLWVRGGGWNQGNQSDATQTWSPVSTAHYGDYYNQKLGVATVGVSWRADTNSNGSFTRMREDITVAIDYLVENAEELNIDPTRIGLYGGSAGSPASALISQTDARVSCYVGMNGLYDFQDRRGGSFGGGTGFGQNAPSYSANSAAQNVRATNSPDTILFHGTADTTIEAYQSSHYAEEITNAGGNGIALLYQNETHAFFNLAKQMYHPTIYASGQHLIRVFDLEGRLTDYTQWSKFYGLAADSMEQDADSDGQSNVAEFHLGTSPLDQNDVFQIQVSTEAGQLKLAFDTKAGYDYKISCSYDLVTWEHITTYSADGASFEGDSAWLEANGVDLEKKKVFFKVSSL